MPLPIRPHPSTPTRPVSVMSRSDDLEGLANLVGDAPEGARSGPGGELLRSDIPALQSVEHLLEADLETLVIVAVAARPPHSPRPRRDHRSGRPRGDRAEHRHHPAERRAEHHESGRAPEALPALPAHVRAEAHVTEPGLELRDLRRDLRGARQGEALDRALSRAPQRSEEHTSELQSLAYLVCRLLLEKKKNKRQRTIAFGTPDRRHPAGMGMAQSRLLGLGPTRSMSPLLFCTGDWVAGFSRNLTTTER